MNIIKSLFAFLIMLVATLLTASHAQAFALGNHAGGFFLGTLDCTEENKPSTRNLCRENGWLNYDTLSGCSVATNNVDKFRRTPNNLAEKLTMDEAKGGAGKKIISNLNDPKFKGMDKMQHVHKHPNGTQTNIHYVRDPKTGKTMDFKFKE
jgi:hypothetical protein